MGGGGSHAVHGSPFTALPLFSQGPCAPIHGGASHFAEGCLHPTEGWGIGWLALQLSVVSTFFPISPLFFPISPQFPTTFRVCPHFPPFFFLRPLRSIPAPCVPSALKTTISQPFLVVYHHFPPQFSKNDTSPPISPHFPIFFLFWTSVPARFR